MIRALWECALDAIDPAPRVAAALEPGGPPVHIYGAGKASVRMVTGALRALGPRVVGGTVLAPTTGTAGPISILAADHPLPGDRSLAGTRELLLGLSAVPADHEVLFLISGGASAMLCAPTVDLATWRDLGTQLLYSGAPIADVNAVRAAFSSVKAGRLADACPAAFRTLIASDVPGDDPMVIGSGPTVPPTTPHDLAALAARWRLRLPVAPQPAPGIRSGPVEIVTRNEDALAAVSQLAQTQGLRVVRGPPLRGPARQMGSALAQQLVGLPERTCLICGGETTVTVRGAGRGGRCQELATAALDHLSTRPGTRLLAAGTDGMDGPTDAAGALVTSETLARLTAAGLSPREALEANDTYPLLEAVGVLLRTGPTGFNAMDVVIGLTP